MEPRSLRDILGPEGPHGCYLPSCRGHAERHDGPHRSLGPGPTFTPRWSSSTAGARIIAPMTHASSAISTSVGYSRGLLPRLCTRTCGGRRTDGVGAARRLRYSPPRLLAGRFDRERARRLEARVRAGLSADVARIRKGPGRERPAISAPVEVGRTSIAIATSIPLSRVVPRTPIDPTTSGLGGELCPPHSVSPSRWTSRWIRCPRTRLRWTVPRAVSGTS